VSPRANKEVRGVSAAVHGAVDSGELARLGMSPEEVVDFSASVNPYGPAPEVLAASRTADVSSYPDRECRELREKIAAYAGVRTEHVTCGNGSAELIDHICRCFLAPGDVSLVVGPTFGEYERASELRGARTLRLDRGVSADGARLDADALAVELRAGKPRVAWLCNPNNPTGDLVLRESVERVLDAAFEVDALVVVDEAYRDLVLGGETPDLTGLLSGEKGENLVLLRSMTKSHSLAGLRLGYALSSPEVAAALAAVRPPWNVSGPAQAAGISALSPSSLRHLEESREKLARDAAYLRRGFSGLGFPVLPGAANYILVDVSSEGGGSEVRRRLLSEGLQVRDCASFGLPGYVRVAVLRREDCERLVGTFKRLFGSRKSARFVPGGSR
jgi:histidinol-phosphate aminotransferase